MTIETDRRKGRPLAKRFAAIAAVGALTLVGAACEQNADGSYTLTETTYVCVNGATGAITWAGNSGQCGPGLIKIKVDPEGVKGADGKNGVDGKDGADGKDGENGDIGPAGPMGPQGPEGIPGSAGLDGEHGENGQSAYELAGGDGAWDDENAWLDSLKGTNGVNGINGENGLSAYELAGGDGEWDDVDEWLGSLKGAKGADGEDGEDGLQGPPGIQGIQGPAGPTPLFSVVEDRLLVTIGDGDPSCLWDFAANEGLGGQCVLD